jgi:cytochrome b561
MRTNGYPAQLPAWRYGAPAILLHWLLALLIAFMAGLGWYMMEVEHDPGGRWYMDLHKSVGLIVFTLVLLRVLWRLFHKPGPLPAGTPSWQLHLSSLTHGLLYTCMVLLPVTGIIGAEYSRAGLAFFGIPLAAGNAPDRSLSKLFFEIHETLVWVLVALVSLHVIAVLKHALAEGDQVFERMWPARPGR